MDPIDLLQACIPTLERLGIGYFVTGSVASATYGEYRNTNDIDIVLRIDLGDADALCECFPEPDFYVSPEAVRDAIARRGRFNVLHAPSGFKIDFMVSSRSEFDQSRFARARSVAMQGGLSLRLASPEDVILKKLVYFQAGGSDKHLRDIAGILRLLREEIESEYVQMWAERMGVCDEWQMAQARARET